MSDRQKRYLTKLSGKEKDRFIGKLKNHLYSWRCKCLYCINETKRDFQENIEIQEYKQEKKIRLKTIVSFIKIEHGCMIEIMNITIEK